jgi:hypothetical protein
MDTNLGQAATAVATVRTLPRLAADWCFLRPTGSGMSVAPVQVVAQGRTLPSAGTYGISGLTSMTTCVVDVLDIDADHKFSTRLGPSASPPV